MVIFGALVFAVHNPARNEKNVTTEFAKDVDVASPRVDIILSNWHPYHLRGEKDTFVDMHMVCSHHAFFFSTMMMDDTNRYIEQNTIYHI